jgi:hypothetical protein
MKKTLRFRRAPWDMEAANLRRTLMPYDPQSEQQEPVSCQICLQGCWFVDPRTATAEDARQFMWDGLRALHREAKARGIPDSQINNMIQEAFGHFHDAATAIYRTLCKIKAAPPKHSIRWFDLHQGGYDLWVESEPEYSHVPCLDEPSLEDCQTVPLVEEASQGKLEKPANEDLFVACEEDRPVPVAVRYRKREPLLDPDRDLLESFEP